jgi:hypothetical protein
MPKRIQAFFLKRFRFCPGWSRFPLIHSEQMRAWSMLIGRRRSKSGLIRYVRLQTAEATHSSHVGLRRPKKLLQR